MNLFSIENIFYYILLSIKNTFFTMQRYTTFFNSKDKKSNKKTNNRYYNRLYTI